jgi:hypothetical protein
MSAIPRFDALLRLAQAQGAAPPPAAAHWVSYGGDEAILLAIVLLVAAGGFAHAGKRLRAPLGVTRTGGTVAGFMIAIWLLAIYTAGVATFVYGLQVKQAYPRFRRGSCARRHVHRCAGDLLRDSLSYAALGLEGRAGQRRHRHRRRADDLRISLRSDRHDADESADPGSSDAISAAFLPAVVPGRVVDGVAADVAAFDAGHRIRLLRCRRNVRGVRDLGRVRLRLSLATAAAGAERHFENPVASSRRSCCLPGGRATKPLELVQDEDKEKKFL